MSSPLGAAQLTSQESTNGMVESPLPSRGTGCTALASGGTKLLTEDLLMSDCGVGTGAAELGSSLELRLGLVVSFLTLSLLDSNGVTSLEQVCCLVERILLTGSLGMWG